jgi:hypothetical protein
VNQYGAQARRYWQEYLPERYAQIEDPEAFFTDLGEEMADQVVELTDSIAGPDRSGEGYLGKVGRLNMARLSAEEQVMREMLPASDNEDENEEPSTA